MFSTERCEESAPKFLLGRSRNSRYSGHLPALVLTFGVGAGESLSERRICAILTRMEILRHPSSCDIALSCARGELRVFRRQAGWLKATGESAVSQLFRFPPLLKVERLSDRQQTVRRPFAPTKPGQILRDLLSYRAGVVVAGTATEPPTCHGCLRSPCYY